MMTQTYLKTIINYDPNTGIFSWKVRKSNSIQIGDIITSIDGRGYPYVMIDGKNYRLHRLAWLYMNGSFPTNQIDHIDTIRTNTKWDNLREANTSQNACNSSLRVDNTTGLKSEELYKQYHKDEEDAQN